MAGYYRTKGFGMEENERCGKMMILAISLPFLSTSSLYLLHLTASVFIQSLICKSPLVWPGSPNLLPNWSFIIRFNQ